MDSISIHEIIKDNNSNISDNGNLIWQLVVLKSVMGNKKIIKNILEKKDLSTNKSPIIFLGMGRSGSTIIYEVLTKHPDLGWFSNYYYLSRHFPQIGLVHNLFGNKRGQKPQGQKLSLFNQIFPRPLEVFTVWEYLCGEKFGNSFLVNDVPTEKEIIKTRAYIKTLLKWQRKKRYCAKLTGPPRVAYLSRIFPDAFFIDVIRDPRAVVSSLISVDFWQKKGVDKPHWGNGFSENDYETWDKFNRSAVALAALEWRTVYRQTIKEKNNIISQYKMIKYEVFMANPQQIISNLLEFTQLNFDENVFSFMKKINYKNMNFKYKEKLSKEEIAIVEQICYNEMKELNYIKG